LSEAVSCAVDVTCDVNQGGLFGRTPLHIAVMKSNLAIVGLLLDNECITDIGLARFMNIVKHSI
jgi:ankyrin repeat protein